MHAAAKASTLRVPVQGVACIWGRQRKSPTEPDSERDSLVDTQSIRTYSGYGAVLRPSTPALQ